MIDLAKIDIARLNAPTKDIKRFVPTNEKVLVLAKHLLEDKWYLQDADRRYELIHALIQAYLHGPMLSIMYEIGNFQGIAGFVNIIPEHKAECILKLWDGKAFGPDLCRQMKDTTNIVMKEFRLWRLDADTPDDKIVRLAKMLGFDKEGSRKYGFMWGSKPYTNYILGKKRK